MELLKVYNRQYLKASSLIESIIAVTLIAICLLIALRLYINVLDSSRSINKTKIRFQITKLVSDTKMNQNFDSEVFEFESYKILKVVTRFEDQENLKKVSYIVQAKSDTIIYNYLILKKYAEE